MTPLLLLVHPGFGVGFEFGRQNVLQNGSSQRIPDLANSAFLKDTLYC